MKKFFSIAVIALLILPVSGSFAASTQEAERNNSSSEIARSVSSGEIGREWRVATYSSPEILRAAPTEIVRTEKEYIYDYVTVHASAPSPTKLTRTGLAENFALMIFALSLIGGGIYLRRRG